MNIRIQPTPTLWRLTGAVLWLVRVVLVLYLLMLLMLLLLENALIFPAPRYPTGEWTPQGLGHEEVYFASADGTKLHGWYIEHPAPMGHLLICHGNGENVSYMADELRMYSQRYQLCVFAFDYRGYGRSGGKPQELGVIADGDAAQAWLAERAGIPQHQIILLGRSLGGAVAVDLASRNGARGLILERTFNRLREVAAVHYPWLPVRRLMRSQFDSERKIARYEGPLLQTHGTADMIVPYELGLQLFKAAPGSPKSFLTVPGGGHNEPHPKVYYEAVGSFLKSLPQVDGGRSVKQ